MIDGRSVDFSLIALKRRFQAGHNVVTHRFWEQWSCVHFIGTTFVASDLILEMIIIRFKVPKYFELEVPNILNLSLS